MVEQQRVPVGIRFKQAGRVYYFNSRGFDLDVGTLVVVETSHGHEIGRVVVAPDQVIASEIKETLKTISRIAEPGDLERAADLKKRARDQLESASREVQDQGLDLHLVSGDYSLDASRLTFYFTAGEKRDIRHAAKALSSQLSAKVELLQVGDRDRAKMVDGLGRCGERLCCSSWLTAFPTTSIRLAKDQDLPLNPSKLSGACGRLLCCLTYEHSQYREVMRDLPKVGAKISTPSGEAKVRKINVPKETITLVMQDRPEQVEITLEEFRAMYGTAIRPKELAEEFEKKLLATRGTGAIPPPERPPKTSVEEVAAPGAAAEERPKRRRRRRGGRRRRKSSGQ